MRHRGLILPAAWLSGWIALALVAKASGGAGNHELARSLAKPSLAHPFGFDAFGRDLVALVLDASLTSLAFAAAAVALSCAIGILLASPIGLAPEWARFPALRLLDFLLAFPSLLLALTLAAIRGPGWDTLLLSLAIGTIPTFTRFLYVRVRELLSEEYILAARGLGAGTAGITRRHLVPALLSTCAVKAPNLFAHALLAEATLSFLGVGAPIGRNTWGSLLAQSRDYLVEAPHLVIGAGLPLVLTVLSMQVLAGNLTEK